MLHNFNGNGKDGAVPGAGLTFDKAWNLYGTTNQGGSSDGGTVFELMHSAGGGWAESILYSFTPKRRYKRGAVDQISGVVFDQAGNLYGTTSIGGDKSASSNTDGRVFELSPQPGGGWTVSYPYLFGQSSTDGITPLGGVVVDNAGNLYGTTVYGGAYGCGTVFELSPTASGRWEEKILYSFVNNYTDGNNPYYGVVLDESGNLYGTTYVGGTSNSGTVFELSPSADGTWTETILHNFTSPGYGPDTGFPENLIFDHGNLYGSTNGWGAGNVFELTPTAGGGWAEQILYSFSGGNPSVISLDSAGNIYGLTEAGINTEGTVYELTPQTDGGSWALTVLYTIDQMLNGPLVLDKQQNLYGTTLYGGSHGAGMVFEVTR